MRNLLVSALLLGSACNVSTTGDRGQLTFTPDDCGQAFCSLDEELAAGTSMIVDLQGVDGSDASHLDLLATDSRVAVVVPVPLFFGDLRWQVFAVDEGWTSLVAVAPSGREIDRTSLRVERPARLGLTHRRGSAAQHAIGPDGVEVWTVSAADSVGFRVRPLDGAGYEMMGKVDLSADVDAGLFVALDPSASLGEGELEVRPMAPGDYGASFYDAQGRYLDVVLEAR